MANWDDDVINGNCFAADTWNDMKDYIKRSGSCNAGAGHILYNNDASATEWFKFTQGQIDFEGTQAIKIYNVNTFVGKNAGLNSADTARNAYFGYSAGANNACKRNSVFGYKAYLSGSGNDNTVVGYEAGQGLTGGSSTVFGNNALKAASSGSFNTIQGNGIGGFHSINSGYNVYIGALVAAGGDTGTGWNTAVGFGAMGTNAITGHANVAVGAYAFKGLSSAANSIAVGVGAGTNCNTSNTSLFGREAGYNNSGAGCLLLGYKTGYNNTTANTLYINNSNSAFPLIYGEFDNDVVKFGDNTSNFFLEFSHEAAASVITAKNNNDLCLRTSGAGHVRFGTTQLVFMETVTEFIEIKDDSGIVRKLAVLT